MPYSFLTSGVDDVWFENAFVKVVCYLFHRSMRNQTISFNAKNKFIRFVCNVYSILESRPLSSSSCLSSRNYHNHHYLCMLCFILHLLSINGSIDQILHFTFESILRFQFTNVKPVSKWKILYHHLIWTFLNNNCRILNTALKPFRKFQSLLMN